LGVIKILFFALNKNEKWVCEDTFKPLPSPLSFTTPPSSSPDKIPMALPRASRNAIPSCSHCRDTTGFGYIPEREINDDGYNCYGGPDFPRRRLNPVVVQQLIYSGICAICRNNFMKKDGPPIPGWILSLNPRHLREEKEYAERLAFLEQYHANDNAVDDGADDTGDSDDSNNSDEELGDYDNFRDDISDIGDLKDNGNAGFVGSEDD